MIVFLIDDNKVTLKILVDSTGILTMMYYMAQQLPCQIKGLGLTGGEEPEQVFSELFLNVYVLKHRSKITFSNFTTETRSESDTEFGFRTQDEETDNYSTKFEAFDEEIKAGMGQADPLAAPKGCREQPLFIWLARCGCSLGFSTVADDYHIFSKFFCHMLDYTVSNNIQEMPKLRVCCICGISSDYFKKDKNSRSFFNFPNLNIKKLVPFDKDLLERRLVAWKEVVGTNYDNVPIGLTCVCSDHFQSDEESNVDVSLLNDDNCASFINSDIASSSDIVENYSTAATEYSSSRPNPSIDLISAAGKYRNEISSLIYDLRRAGVESPQEYKLGDLIHFDEQDTEMQENSERHIDESQNNSNGTTSFATDSSTEGSQDELGVSADNSKPVDDEKQQLKESIASLDEKLEKKKID
ncbi:Uncharacterized protein APZ42_033364 [Daphnia magna]|uniref:Uncharacterized protein n=1 Tax=Daphnia magna TaxID=35525 RepID=A0A164L5V2_9CRUS|nr:Uncharacterized protein APZ42_033364 [Daphnia magna]